MGMILKGGKALKIGIEQAEGMIAQTGSKTSGGELKVYKDENGNEVSLYVNDEHTEVSVNGLLEADVAQKKIGDKVTLCGVEGYVTSWVVNWTNEDVANVSGTIRTYNIGTTSGS